MKVNIKSMCCIHYLISSPFGVVGYDEGCVHLFPIK